MIHHCSNFSFYINMNHFVYLHTESYLMVLNIIKAFYTRVRQFGTVLRILHPLNSRVRSTAPYPQGHSMEEIAGDVKWK